MSPESRSTAEADVAADSPMANDTLSQANPADSRGWWARTSRTMLRWIDTEQVPAAAESAALDRIDWLRASPFVAMHLACLAVIWVGVSPIALAVAAAMYAIRMFALTGFYHRYFSHRTFRTSRAVQFVFPRELFQGST